MRASLYLADEFPTDEEGNPVMGFVRVGTHPDGRLILHAEPGQEPLGGMEVLESGRQRPWDWPELPERLPHLAPRLLEAAVYRHRDGRRAIKDRAEARELVRREEADRRRVPLAAVRARDLVDEEGLPPHYWAGDQP